MSINMSFAGQSSLNLALMHLKARGFECQKIAFGGKNYHHMSTKESKFITFFKLIFLGIARNFSERYNDSYKESKAVWKDKKNVYVFDCPLPQKALAESTNSELPKSSVVVPKPADVVVESASSSSSSEEEAPSRFEPVKKVAGVVSVVAASIAVASASAAPSRFSPAAVEIKPVIETVVAKEEKPMEVASHLPIGLKTLKLSANETVVKAFAINSSQVQGTSMARNEFMAKNDPAQYKPLILSKSEFVPENMAVHLMKNKRDAAIGTKYLPKSSITNMEGAMHSFLTPIASIQMCGDYAWKGHHSLQPVGGLRNVVLSAAIHPDFECGGDSEVVMKLVEVKAEAQVGKPLSEGFQPLASKTANPEEFKAGLAQYELELQQHMIYHLTADHRLPSEIEVGALFNPTLTMQMLESWIQSDTFDPAVLKNQVAAIGGRVISLEAMFSLYVHQICNEFSALEALLPQGYVYTIDPPAIFVAQLGGAQNAAFLNRLQALALKCVHANTPLQNLKLIGFNNFADPKGLEMLKHVFPGKVVPKADLFQNTQNYSVNKNWALVLHNNSDAFGQNIQTEGASSMDGVIGVYSDAAIQLKREREDIGAFMV